ncbi:hypothetical protein KFV02_07165 [Desulfohalobiaceae bacterium Ax17]|uniref:hypothetical protein n=1 Tax=Desulfovulcanus ferrireducens TaxID=2831190 RepID=UPI00207BBB4A|nr:hypothetical protein [Desulfovulcanus ferrireducens]MBT8763711.1 hypothetical protein [Desulfovulcanus ferrireducens]
MKMFICLSVCGVDYRLALEKGISPGMQRLALNTIVFLDKQVLNRALMCFL